MSEATSTSKEQRVEKLKAQQKAIQERARAVALKLRRVESADKAKRKKADDRTKLLVGVAFFEIAQRNPQVRELMTRGIQYLTERDQEFLLGESELFGEFLKETKKITAVA